MQLLIFDLDGTLIDSRLDLANAVNATRLHMGLEPLTNETVYSYVGNGAPVLIRKSLGAGFNDAEVGRGLEYFLDHYSRHALVSTTLYPGVLESVDRLAAAGKQMAVLTNKPVRISQSIMEGLKLSDRFFRVYGGNSFEQKKPDPVGIEALMREAGVDRTQTVMIGDSNVDIQTGRNAGVACCGVTYGFQPESLADPVPDLVADRMELVADWVLAHSQA